MKNKPAGFKLGFGLFITGIILGLINHAMLYYYRITIELLLGYPIFVFWGVSFMIRPGAKVKSLKSSDDIQTFIKQSSKLDYAVWFIFLVIGAVGLIFQMFYYDLQ